MKILGSFIREFYQTFLKRINMKDEETLLNSFYEVSITYIRTRQKYNKKTNNQHP